LRRSTIPVLLIALTTLAGCGGSADDPGTAASPSSPSSPSSPASSPGAPTSGSPSGATAPATGIALSMPNSTVRAPADWTHAKDLTRYEDGADSPDNLAYVMLGEIDAFGSDASAAELADNRLSANVYERAPKKLPVAELDGTPAYHLAGPVSATQYIEEYGAIVRDRIVTLTFSFNDKVTRAERDEVVASVLPTFAWQ